MGWQRYGVGALERRVMPPSYTTLEVGWGGGCLRISWLSSWHHSRVSVSLRVEEQGWLGANFPILLSEEGGTEVQVQFSGA